MKVRVLKLKSVNSKMSGSRNFHVSSAIPITTLCIVMFVERLVKPNLSLEKKFKRESLVYHNKTESLKHENCFNDNVVSEKAHSSNKYLLCLIQGINNYVQINRYWRYIVRIMASNILLLASKKSFLTSQGLVGAGMNCRAL